MAAGVRHLPAVRYETTCDDCGETVEEGSEALWYPGWKLVHVKCPEPEKIDAHARFDALRALLKGEGAPMA